MAGYSLFPLVGCRRRHRQAQTIRRPAALAHQSGIPRTKLVRYLELLSSVFLVKSIPAWSSGHTHRAIGTPKPAFVDTGIASHLIGRDAARLGEPGDAAGPMTKNFVLMELARQLTWSEQRTRLHHYRTKDKVEVDAVIETPDGRVVGIEVKAGATVRTEDLSGLRNLANLLGERFIAGIVLYTSQQTLKTKAIGALRRLQKLPHLVRGFFADSAPSAVALTRSNVMADKISM